mmetsp:Transcript_16930/g.12108  ORF Transcript_16930/g.12108 Transcript_16930/m.12108 type:complete len:88 (+) Transcript_16930:984-1247(+)
MNKKRPIYTLPSAHSPNSWVLSTDTIFNCDLLCSGSYDGSLNLYQFDKEKKDLKKINEVEGLPGCINCAKFTKVDLPSGEEPMIAVG